VNHGLARRDFEDQRQERSLASIRASPAPPQTLRKTRNGNVTTRKGEI